MNSVIDLCVFIVEGCPYAFLFICPKVHEFRQSLYPCPILLQLRMVLKDTVLSAEEVHVVQSLKHYKVHIVHIVTNKELLVAEESVQLSCLLIYKVLQIL
jgi:uncharacterized membrane protein YkgB